MKLIITFVLISIFAVSCVDEQFTNQQIIGTYIPINYKNNFDTIKINLGGDYLRKVYDKHHKLLLNMRGNYKFVSPNSIDFDNFYLNLDDSLDLYPELVRDISGGRQAVIEAKGGKILFCVGYTLHSNCYEKVE